MKSKEYVKDTIDTSADDSIKGVELQKLRVIKRLLDAIKEQQKNVYCAVELIDDVSQVTFCDESMSIVAEQDKFYNTSLSLNSNEVKKSLRTFFDTWRRIEYSEQIKFIFYSTSPISKESRVGVLKAFDEIPESGILQSLSQGEIEGVLDYAIEVFKDYYKSIKLGSKDFEYYANVVDELERTEWMKFFSLIEWNFCSKTTEEIKKDLLNTIESLCDYYNIEVLYCEYIYAALKELINSTNGQRDFLNKMIPTEKVELTFLRMAKDAKVEKNIDPIHTRWDEIKVNDFRNMKEKIVTVSKGVQQSFIDSYFEDMIDGKLEQANHPSRKAVKAFNYRVLKKSKRLIDELLKSKDDTSLTTQELDEIIDFLTNDAYEHVKDKSKTYKLPFMDKDMVRNTILILLEDCYLCFELEACHE